jgi:FkbM family methyltransferase
VTDRVIAKADGYRRPGIVERVATRLSRLASHPSIRQPLKRILVRALMLLTRGRGLPASLPGGESVRVLPEYRYMSWNPDEYRAFRESARPGMTALDIGANVGAYSLLLGQWVGPAGAVFAFEPAPHTHDGLRRQIRLNGLDAVVTPVRAAVGAAPVTATFVIEPTAGEGRLAIAGTTTDGAGTTVDVQVTTIDEFCARERLTPGFIKIDVEGAELDVLRGARETIRRTRGRLALFVEMHPSIWARSGLSVADIRAELDRQQLDAVPLTPTDDPWAIEGVCLRLVPRS